MGQHRNADGSAVVPTGSIIAGVVVLLGLFAMATGLGLAGWQPESIIALVVGLGSVAGTLLPLVTQVINRLDRVEHNTNGKLTQTVTDAVHEAVPSAIQEAVQSGQSTQDDVSRTLTG